MGTVACFVVMVSVMGIVFVVPSSAATTISQIGGILFGEGAQDASGGALAMSADGTRVAVGASGNDGNGFESSGHVRVFTWSGTAWTKMGTDIDGEAAYDNSGSAVAMSADGNRVVIGAPYNNGTGAGGGVDFGQARVYTWSGTAWTQTGIDIDGEAANDRFGTSVAISDDGTRIAVGAPSNNGSGSRSGHVRVYTWSGSSWTQTGSDINGEAIDDFSGTSVAMSAEGNRIAIGAYGNDGNGSNSGHVRVYSWSGSSWAQTGSDINGEAIDDTSGTTVTMSDDGNRIAIASQNNDGNGSNSGHVRVYSWSGSSWTQTGSDINGAAADDRSGTATAMAADGTRIAIGSPSWEYYGDVKNSGRVDIYDWNGSTWQQNPGGIPNQTLYSNEFFGSAVTMSEEGTRVGVGVPDANANFVTRSGLSRIYLLSTTSPGLTTTTAPTTIAPTTIAPTTVAPTTIAPTTIAPTTIAPTTVAPTTIAPTTTVAPTTTIASSTSTVISTSTSTSPTTTSPTTIAPTTTPTSTQATSPVVVVSTTTIAAPVAPIAPVESPVVSVAQQSPPTTPKPVATPAKAKATVATTTTTPSPTTTIPVTTTTPKQKTDIELFAGASTDQVSSLAKQADSDKGAALLIDGQAVEVDVRTTSTSMTLTYKNASLEVKCFDKDGSELALTGANRFALRHSDTVKVVATGFLPASSINVAVFSNPVALGSVTVDSQGKANQLWAIPESIPAGDHTLVISGDLAGVDNTVFGLRIVVNETSLVSRIASSTWTRVIIALGIFGGLLVPANRRRRRQQQR